LERIQRILGSEAAQSARVGAEQEINTVFNTMTTWINSHVNEDARPEIIGLVQEAIRNFMIISDSSYIVRTLQRVFRDLQSPRAPRGLEENFSDQRSKTDIAPVTKQTVCIGHSI
jgi:hypothetical protein